jgi:hypothetical protein
MAHVGPAVVADGALIRFVGFDAMLFEPMVDIVVKILFRPEHAGEGLTHYAGGIGIQRRRNH